MAEARAQLAAALAWADGVDKDKYYISLDGQDVMVDEIDRIL